jgi:Arc/MetJ-type ribon-helix-helix transcriptional regulator
MKDDTTRPNLKARDGSYYHVIKKKLRSSLIMVSTLKNSDRDDDGYTGACIVTISMPRVLLSLIDHLVEADIFPNRSLAMRVIMARFLRDIGYDVKFLEKELSRSYRSCSTTDVYRNPIGIINHCMARCREMDPPDSIDRRGSRVITIGSSSGISSAFKKTLGKDSGFYSRSEFIRISMLAFLKEIGWLKCIYTSKQSDVDEMKEHAPRKMENAAMIDFRKNSP